MLKFFTAGLVVMSVVSFSTMTLAEAPNPKGPNPKSFITRTPAALTLDPEALDLAKTFVEKTLPNLIGDDPVLATQLGFAPPDLQSFKESGAALQPPYPVLIIALRDLFEFVQHPSDPVDLIKKEVNWIQGPEGTLIPARWLFPIEIKQNVGNNGVVPRTSVIIGKSPSSPWRVHQIGGPNLVRAVKQWATSDTIAVVWIPGLNRHYLGQVTPYGAVMLKVLFDDPLAGVKAGKEFDPSDEKVINYLKYLEERLKLKEGLQAPPMLQSPTAR